jgi:nucleoside-diphosphate-sugar epimerase
LRQVLITGADGYLGRRIAQALVQQAPVSLMLYVRADDADEFDAKRRTLENWLTLDGDSSVSYHWGDLRSPEPFVSVEPDSITHIIHSAAITRLNVGKEDAWAVNVEGTRRVLTFARRCSNLEAMVYLSSVYGSGLSAGLIEEAPFVNAAGFANHYEASKFEAEALVTGDYDDLPWRIMRTVTVLADDPSGAVSQYNAIHNTLKLFHYGLLSLMPGHPETPVYMVNGDYVADAVAQLLTRSTHRDIFHCCHDREATLTLSELLDVVYDCFRTDDKFHRANIPKPLFCDMESFNTLVQGVGQFGGSVVTQAVGSVAPFAGQLFVTKDISNEHMRAALADYNAVDSRAVLEATCRQLVAQRFGRKAA